MSIKEASESPLDPMPSLERAPYIENNPKNNIVSALLKRLIANKNKKNTYKKVKTVMAIAAFALFVIGRIISGVDTVLTFADKNTKIIKIALSLGSVAFSAGGGVLLLSTFLIEIIMNGRLSKRKNTKLFLH